MPPYTTEPDFFVQADAQDILCGFKNEIYVPTIQNQSAIYFCGKSLGLQPKKAVHIIHGELNSWRNNAIEGFFHGSHPWLYYQEYAKPTLAKVIGCLPHEVTVMNTLTVNLHLLLMSF
jgi:kynureninase